MDDDEDFGEDEYELVDEFVTIPARPLDWRPVVGFLLGGLANTFTAWSETATNLAQVFLGAANHEIEMSDAHRQMTAELEQILEGE